MFSVHSLSRTGGSMWHLWNLCSHGWTTGQSMNCLTEATTMQKEIADCHIKQEESDGNLLWQIKPVLVCERWRANNALNKIRYSFLLKSCSWQELPGLKEYGTWSWIYFVQFITKMEHFKSKSSYNSDIFSFVEFAVLNARAEFNLDLQVRNDTRNLFLFVREGMLLYKMHFAIQAVQYS